MKKILVPVSFMAIMFGCKKSDVPSSNTQEEDCVSQNAAANGDIIPGQYIVAYTDAAMSRRAARAAVSFDENILSRNQVSSDAIMNSFEGGVAGFVARLSAGEAAALAADEDVAIVEPDRVVALSTCFTVVEPRLITWNINKVGYGNGIGKTAWIIDTGIDFDHPDLTVDATRNRSFLSGGSSADDENGHGTHVAGIIAAKNNSIGTLGVASGATCIALRVLDKDGSGAVSGIVQALAYVNANGRAGDVVNLSLGEEGVSEVLDQQVINTGSKGIYVAIAAGNDAKPAALFSPARANGTNVYTVSAIDSTNRFASFSNYGNDVVDYAAPGVRILSSFKGGQYAMMSGTSMAAPHVAGLLLLKGRSISSSGSAINDPDGNADLIAHY